METLNLDLPEPMRRFVQERATEGGYGSAGEYLRALIQADQQRQAQEHVDALLLEGLDSGEPIPVTDEFWEQKKRKLIERFGESERPQ